MQDGSKVGGNMVIVEGKIKGKQRPRFWGSNVYTPSQTVNYENWVRICYKQQNGKYHTGPLKATITAWFEIPKSYSKSKIEACETNNIRPIKKPDTDNIAKIILDSLNGLAYKDDSQVVDLNVRKLYTNLSERVEFRIERLED